MTDGSDATASALVASACSSDVDEALDLLDANPELARRDLACACVTGDNDVVAACLDDDPGVARRALEPFGWEPILYACFSRLPRVEPQRAAGVRETVRLLLGAGADPNAEFTHEDWRQVPLYGADPNDDSEAHTVGEVLYHACEFPDPACARLLIEARTARRVVRYCLGRALNFPYSDVHEVFCAHLRRAPSRHLHQALWRRRPPQTVTALLNAGARVDEPDAHGLMPLQIARMWGDDAIAALLLDRGAREAAGSPVAPPLDDMLQIAIAQGDLQSVRRLLDGGAAFDGAGIDAPLAQACWRGHPEVVRELVTRGAALVWENGAAMVATQHGSRNCHHPEGGPTMQTVQEISQEPYREIERILDAAAG